MPHYVSVSRKEKGRLAVYVEITPSLAGPLPQNAETKTLKKLVRDIIDPSRNLGHVDGHKKAAVTNPSPNNNNINTDDIEKESSGHADHAAVVVVVAGGGPILSSSTVEEGGEEDSSKQLQQMVGREDVANKSEERGLTTKESDQEKKVCYDCA